MTTQYTPILKLALPVQGELSGTWGDVVNDNITSMVEQAIAGLSVINTWSTNSHVLTTANGTTAESRAAMLSLTDSGTALTGAGSVICPALSKVYIVKNGTAQVITVKTAAGSGIAVPVGKTMLVYCDGTDVLEAVDHVVTLSAGTLTVTGAATFGGNVGIGSSDFGSGGTINLSVGVAGVTAGGLQLWASPAQTHYMQFGDSTAGGAPYSGAVGYNHGTDSLLFLTAGSSKLTIDSAGAATFSGGVTANNRYIVQSTSNAGVSDISYGSYVNGAWINGLLGSDSYLATAGNAVLKWNSAGIDVTGAATFSGNVTTSRANATVYSGTSSASWANGVILTNTSTAATGVTSLINFQGSGNVNTVFGVTQAASGYGDFVWASYNGTFSQKMTLDASGNLGIGTSSPTSPLHIRSATDVNVRFDDSGSSSYTWYMNDAQNIYIPNVQLASTHTFYANGQRKVDIDSSGNVGIGTSSPSFLGFGSSTGGIDIVNSTNAALRLSGNAADAMFFVSGSGQHWLYGKGAVPMTFSTNGIERMRLDANGNLGIGTSSPNAVTNYTGLTLNNATYGGFIDIENNGTHTFRLLSNTDATYIGTIEADPLVFNTGNAERMRIDSSGNLGLGVVPSAWAGTNHGSMDFGSGLVGAVNADLQVGVNLSNNMYWNGANWLNKTAAYATSYYNQSIDGHEWYYNAPAALGTFTPTRLLKLSASGNVIHNMASGSAISQYIEAGVTRGYIGTSNSLVSAGLTSFCVRGESGIILSIAGSQATVIDASGNVGVGVSVPLAPLHVAGSIYSATSLYISRLQGNAQLSDASVSSGSNPSYIGQGLISVSISDAKAKENFGAVEKNECLNKVVALAEHVKKFDWIDEDWKKEKGRTVGMVAQEIYEDHSEFVHKPESYNDNGWAIRHQEMVPTLVKAIQEQQAIIEALTARIDALEGA